MLSDEVICSREIDSEVSQIWIKSTLFRSVWHRMKFRLVSNQLKKCKLQYEFSLA